MLLTVTVQPRAEPRTASGQVRLLTANQVQQTSQSWPPRIGTFMKILRMARCSISTHPHWCLPWQRRLLRWEVCTHSCCSQQDMVAAVPSFSQGLSLTALFIFWNTEFLSFSLAQIFLKTPVCKEYDWFQETLDRRWGDVALCCYLGSNEHPHSQSRQGWREEEQNT